MPTNQGQIAAFALEMIFVMDSVADHQSDTEKIPKLKILVADDDVLSQRLMQILLKREDMTWTWLPMAWKPLRQLKLRN